jgi:hypothetical protein
MQMKKTHDIFLVDHDRQIYLNCYLFAGMQGINIINIHNKQKNIYVDKLSCTAGDYRSILIKHHFWHVEKTPGAQTRG